MADYLRLLSAVTLALLLSACGGGGGGTSTTSTGTPPAGGGGPATGSGPGAYADAQSLQPFISAASVPAGGRVIVDFQLSNENGVAITDLTGADLRLTIAKLEFSSVGNLRGNWQSYINDIEMPGVGPGTQPKLQADYEAGGVGTLSNEGNGHYRYQFAASITDITDQAVLDLAAAEDLNLTYQPQRMHRVAMEFRNTSAPANTSFDWVPATGVTQLDGIFHYDVVANPNCNDCHQQISFHGGARIEMRYCVTCHNPGSADANSGNSLSFRDMVHKIHMGAQLPSVQAGTPYVFWGFRDQPVDYSHVHYPNDITSCAQCHGGNATGADTTRATDAGDNWAEYATTEACGSCHDELDFSLHYGGQPNDDNCMSCHQTSGVAGSISESHFNQVQAASGSFAAQILDVSRTAPGEFPEIRFAIVDPENGDAPYDITSDPAWIQPPTSRLAIDLAWSTTDYTNTGNEREDASAVSVDALANPVAVGDGSFIVTSAVAIPNGTLPPGVAASGSGGVVIEGHAAADFGTGSIPDLQQVALTNVVGYFNIDEPDGIAMPRRDIADLAGCLDCHGQLSVHGDNRTNTVQGCATCHNPANTDRAVREIALAPPTDGKDEESLDFKTMIHGIHASRMRVKPLQIVGFRGFSTLVYDEAHVQYPGDLRNCTACHLPETYTLPLPSSVLATTFDTGVDPGNPADDRVITPISATCSSCHDADSAVAHMQNNGGNFDTTQQAIDTGLVVEQCDICHGAGRVADVKLVHGLD